MPPAAAARRSSRKTVPMMRAATKTRRRLLPRPSSDARLLVASSAGADLRVLYEPRGRVCPDDFGHVGVCRCCALPDVPGAHGRAEVSVERLLAGAERGDSEAQRMLGDLFKRGDGVPRDETQALHLFRLAAEQGNPCAQTDLGVMYRHGCGVPADVAVAEEWFSLAARRGFPIAMYNLARIKEADGLSGRGRRCTRTPQKRGRARRAGSASSTCAGSASRATATRPSGSLRRGRARGEARRHGSSSGGRPKAPRIGRVFFNGRSASSAGCINFT